MRQMESWPSLSMCQSHVDGMSAHKLRCPVDLTICLSTSLVVCFSAPAAAPDMSTPEPCAEVVLLPVLAYVLNIGAPQLCLYADCHSAPEPSTSTACKEPLSTDWSGVLTAESMAPMNIPKATPKADPMTPDMTVLTAQLLIMSSWTSCSGVVGSILAYSFFFFA